MTISNDKAIEILNKLVSLQATNSQVSNKEWEETLEAIKIAIDYLHYDLEDAISRKEVNYAIWNKVWTASSSTSYDDLQKLRNEINNIPSIRKKRVSYWNPIINTMGEGEGKMEYIEGYKCSDCNNFSSTKFKYCPNCGASMNLNIK